MAQWPVRRISSSALLLLIAILGILLRVKVYIDNRSLIIDEANLARNIVEKGYSDFFHSLGYEQFAPPLFSALSKALTQLFGVSEFVLKLPALAGGIASIILLFFILKELIPRPPVQWYVMLIFVFSVLGIRYSSEFKQYSTDAALTLFFVLWALKSQHRVFGLRLLVLWATVGAVAIWFSMPVIFTLASISVAFLYNIWKAQRKLVSGVLVPVVVWAISFALYFILILHNDVQREGLADYHNRYYFDFIPTDQESLFQNLSLIQGLFKSVTDPTILALIWSVLTGIFGAVVLWKEQKFVALVLLTPILLCLIASHFHVYSLVDRLVLFLLPLISLTMGIGIARLWSCSGKAVRITMAIIMLISAANKLGFQYFWKTMKFEASKEMMSYLDTHINQGELIYVHPDGVPAFVFYNTLHDDGYGFKNAYLASWGVQPTKELMLDLQSNNSNTFWLFFSHTFPQETIDAHLALCDQFAQEIDRHISVNASVYRFEFD